VRRWRCLAGSALLVLVLTAGCTTWTGAGTPAPTPGPLAGETADVLYFWGEGCHACHGATAVVEELARDHPGLSFDLVEVYRNETNASRYRAVNEALNVSARGLPEAVADGRAFFGESEIRAGLPDAVRAIEARR
jgi:thiol-disulfide isomerase/thioredoxin